MNLEQANRLSEGEDREKVQLYVEIGGGLKVIGTGYMRIEPGSRKLVLVPARTRAQRVQKEGGEDGQDD